MAIPPDKMSHLEVCEAYSYAKRILKQQIKDVEAQTKVVRALKVLVNSTAPKKDIATSALEQIKKQITIKTN